jgi:hypothetical protein
MQWPCKERKGGKRRRASYPRRKERDDGTEKARKECAAKRGGGLRQGSKSALAAALRGIRGSFLITIYHMRHSECMRAKPASRPVPHHRVITSVHHGPSSFSCCHPQAHKRVPAHQLSLSRITRCSQCPRDHQPATETRDTRRQGRKGICF